MVISQTRSKRKASGGRYRTRILKRKYELGRAPSMTKLGKSKSKQIRTIGGNSKTRLMTAEFANVSDPKTKKTTKQKIVTILENPANRHYVRRNIITKGTVIQLEKNKAKVTGRPGQDGIVNAVLIK